MSERHPAYIATKEALSAFSAWIFPGFAILVLFVVASAAWSPTDNTDNGPLNRSGMILRTDHGTGCQYLETRSGGLTPRLKNGVPMCQYSQKP